MMISKVPVLGIDGKPLEAENQQSFVNQLTFKIAHKKFLEVTGAIKTDSKIVGQMYRLGEQDGIAVRTLPDDDVNKVNLQNSVQASANIDASRKWWEQAAKVAGVTVADLDIAKIAEKYLTIDDFVFDDLTAKEASELRERINFLNTYIEEYQKETDSDKKAECLDSIKKLLPKQIRQSATIDLSYRQLAQLAVYGKEKEGFEWTEFMVFARGLDQYNEIIAPKDEQQKTKTEQKQEEKAQAVLDKVERRQQKREERKEKFEQCKVALKDKYAKLKNKVAIWEIKAIFDLYFTGEAIVSAIKKGARKIYSGAKSVASKVKGAVVKEKATAETTEKAEEMTA